jgi:hypothetical protein
MSAKTEMLLRAPGLIFFELFIDFLHGAAFRGAHCHPLFQTTACDVTFFIKCYIAQISLEFQRKKSALRRDDREIKGDAE